MTSDDKLVVIIWFLIVFFACFGIYSVTKIEHEKTIQKAIECGYQPISIGGDYWNKGD